MAKGKTGDPRPAASQSSTKGRVPGSGGTYRGPSEVEDLTDACENLHMYGASRHQIARALGEHLARRRAKLAGVEFRPDMIEPFSVATADDYIRRVKDRWLENPLPDREEYREKQSRRIEGQIRSLTQAGKHGEVEKRERILAKIRGTEMPSGMELSAPGGEPLPLPVASPAQAIKVVVYVPDNGKRQVKAKVEPDPEPEG